VTRSEMLAKRAPRPMKGNRGAPWRHPWRRGTGGVREPPRLLSGDTQPPNTAAQFTFPGLTSNVGALAYRVPHRTSRHQRYLGALSEVAADRWARRGMRTVRASPI
jgi:hypothetical protein